MSWKHQNKNLIITMPTHCYINRQSRKLQIWVILILRVLEVIHITWALMIYLMCGLQPSCFHHAYQANPWCPCYNYYIRSNLCTCKICRYHMYTRMHLVCWLKEWHNIAKWHGLLNSCHIIFMELLRTC